MDFYRSVEADTDRKPLSMTALDPCLSFGIREGDESPKQHYKISLALIRKNHDSYVLIKNERL